MAQSPPNEILQEIFKHFVNDIDYLHSCLLVNKIWSSNVVPVLWNRPFHLLLHNHINLSHQIISTYLACLDNEERSKLDINGISRSYYSSQLSSQSSPCSFDSSLSTIFDLPLSYSVIPSHPPTYNYPSFLRHLSYFSFIASVQEWCAVNNNWNPYAMRKIVQALFRLFAKFSPGLETLVFVMDMDMSLDLAANGLLLFDENHHDFDGVITSANSTLNVKRNWSILLDPIVCNWMSHIKEIELAGDFVIDQNFPVLLTICKNLKKMEIRLPDFEYDEDGKHYDCSVEMSARFLKVQRGLEQFTLRESHYPKAIGAALIRQKSSLRHVEFIDTVFDNRCPLDWLPYCTHLESLTFIDSEMLIPKILTPLRLAPLKRLKSLTFREDPVPTDILQILIHSSNVNLQEIVFGWPEDCRQDGHSYILDSISKFCPFLTKLGATIGRHEISELFLILSNCRYLQCLEIYGNGCLLDVNEFLPELGKFLPTTLGELDIGARWRFRSDILARFLENSKHVSLYKFVIQICDFINEEHLRVIVRHSMSSLKYFTLWNKNFSVTQDGMGKASEWLRKSVS
ncbi:17185_t:CDS:2 [Funneliformis caledonium]|uniref:17185_t:CDS:1 n=1 Tax=Funneliformis caledonium TaxID=1117310 RepID=A0A9N8ZLT0_9GLOM|nr:17185_t:CDS:2 [Funneliformis caledonium]